MTPDIKELATKIGYVNVSSYGNETWMFNEDSLAEFARLIRVEDVTLMRQSLDALLDDAIESRNREQISAIAALRARLEGPPTSSGSQS